MAKKPKEEKPPQLFIKVFYISQPAFSEPPDKFNTGFAKDPRFEPGLTGGAYEDGSQVRVYPSREVVKTGWAGCRWGVTAYTDTSTIAVAQYSAIGEEIERVKQRLFELETAQMMWEGHF